MKALPFYWRKYIAMKQYSLFSRVPLQFYFPKICTFHCFWSISSIKWIYNAFIPYVIFNKEYFSSKEPPYLSNKGSVWYMVSGKPN